MINHLTFQKIFDMQNILIPYLKKEAKLLRSLKFQANFTKIAPKNENHDKIQKTLVEEIS